MTPSSIHSERAFYAEANEKTWGAIRGVRRVRVLKDDPVGWAVAGSALTCSILLYSILLKFIPSFYFLGSTEVYTWLTLWYS